MCLDTFLKVSKGNTLISKSRAFHNVGAAYTTTKCIIRISGYCRLLGSYKSRIKKAASLNVCADCGTKPHDVKHLFVCPAHPTTLRPSDLWSRPTHAVRELSYLEARDPD